jgi:hypothetical protein
MTASKLRSAPKVVVVAEVAEEPTPERWRLVVRQVVLRVRRSSCPARVLRCSEAGASGCRPDPVEPAERGKSRAVRLPRSGPPGRSRWCRLPRTPSVRTFSLRRPVDLAEPEEREQRLAVHPRLSPQSALLLWRWPTSLGRSCQTLRIEEAPAVRRRLPRRRQLHFHGRRQALVAAGRPPLRPLRTEDQFPFWA